MSWRRSWREPGFRTGLLAVAIAVLPIAIGLPRFFAYIEGIAGTRPLDPLLAAIGPVNVTWLTFTVLYSTLVLTVARALGSPWTILRGLHAYALLMLLRVLSMRAFVLEPPTDIIPLIDPVTQSFYPGATPFLKDLFFSGHTASLALMVCIARGRTARMLTITAAAVVGLLVILQHVHWTVDVLAAPIFVWLAWKGAAFTLRVCGAEAF